MYLDLKEWDEIKKTEIRGNVKYNLDTLYDDNEAEKDI